MSIPLQAHTHVGSTPVRPDALPGLGPLAPTPLLRTEGAALLAIALAGYARLGGGWWVFAAAFLLPDLAMAGYLAGKRAGAAVYNLTHTETLPLVLLGAGVATGRTTWTAAGLVWLAHIGFDRMLGAGLKYPTAFRDTHLQRTAAPDAGR